MKANELRIGNYYQENGKTYTTEYYDIANLVRCELADVVSDMQVIPLTEEWLLKLGFKKNNDLLNIRAGGVEIDIELFKDIVDCYIESIGVEIKYVHQLQNLYFSLTGEELTIK